MKTEEHLLKRIIDFLNESSNYAILRNYQDIPKQTSRDIDIIIERTDFYSIRKPLVNILYEFGYHVLMYYKGGEMHSFAFASYKKERRFYFLLISCSLFMCVIWFCLLLIKS